MSFAIFLLLLLAIVSIAGTLIEQNAPLHHYLTKFGPIGLRWINLCRLDHLYNAGWFLGIVFFLILSTGTCLCRRIPTLVRSHLSSVKRKLPPWTYQTTVPYLIQTKNIERVFKQYGKGRSHFQYHDHHCLVEHGRYGHSAGYLLTHLAILIIFLGGFLDSEALLHLWAWKNHKHPTQTNPTHYDNTLWPEKVVSFKGYMFLSPGETNDRATLYLKHGSMLQQLLPFTLTLKKLTSVYYSTGHIKNFVSELIVRLNDGRVFCKKISVNHPLTIDRITIHQASFSDKKSLLHMHVVSLLPHDRTSYPPITATVGSSGVLPTDLLRITDFHAASLRPHHTPHATVSTQVDVGPRFSYRWSHETAEYENFIQPIFMDQDFWFLFGVRAAHESRFTYWFVPADEQKSLHTFLAIEQILFDPRYTGQLSHALALHLRAHHTSIPPAVLEVLCAQLLAHFAQHGLDRIHSSMATVQHLSATKKQATLSVFISLLQGLIYEAWTLADKQRPAHNDKNARFLSHIFLALAQMHHYPAHRLVVVDRYQLIRSSVVQVSSSQGKPFVYVGSGMLVVGLLFLCCTRQHIWSIMVQDQKTILAAYFYPHHPADAATFNTIVQQLIQRGTTESI